MTWNKAEIKRAFQDGLDQGKYSHMLVAVDTYDYENYPIYVPKGNNPKDYEPKGNMQRLEECYSYALSWVEQSVGRVYNWEWSTEEENTKVEEMAESTVTNIRFLQGDMVETTLTELPDGKKFILLGGISVPVETLKTIGLEWEEAVEPEIVKFEDITVKVIGRRIREGKIISFDMCEDEISVTTEDYNYAYVYPGDSLELT